jgi:hypothetical protein
MAKDKKILTEYDRLRKAWLKWNSECHPEDKIDWQEFLEEHANTTTS